MGAGWEEAATGKRGPCLGSSPLLSPAAGGFEPLPGHMGGGTTRSWEGGRMPEAPLSPRTSGLGGYVAASSNTPMRRNRW